MSKFLIIFSVGLAFFLTTLVSSVSAADCKIIYGGGKMDCPVATPAPQTIMASPTQIPVNQTQSKGGLPIQPKPEVKTTPATGPETLALMSLLPMAAAGMWLRKKTR